jgi:hypothetical protein
MHPGIVNCNFMIKDTKGGCYYHSFRYQVGLCCGKLRKNKLCPYRNRELDYAWNRKKVEGTT